MLSQYTILHHRKVNSFCNPVLQHFNVIHFWYYKVTQEGYYTCLGSHVPWMEYYFSENLHLPNPYLRSPNFFKSGVSFIRHVRDSAYQASVDIGVSRFGLDQSLVLLERNGDDIEGFGFASSLPSPTFERLSINEMAILRLFVNKFRDEFHPLIRDMSNNLVDIASQIGPKFYTAEKSLQLPHVNRIPILKRFRLERILLLTKREKEVLKLVSRGFTASQIASDLTLSRRTVEHYIDHIRDKLYCKSKIELIQKGNDYLSLGYSLP